MNAFLSTLDARGISKEDPCLKRSELTTLQINMGNVCNQNCAHCHVGASPEGRNVMSRQVIDSILKFSLSTKSKLSIGAIKDFVFPPINCLYFFLIENKFFV